MAAYFKVKAALDMARSAFETKKSICQTSDDNIGVKISMRIKLYKYTVSMFRGAPGSHVER
ncbi:hypothetical protein [Proteiniphilum sp. UBA5510]|jgi:hypothetical protein|uniref:hypothetical protein n=1 Tax=Proteiniphilum sp. UBA5510 TaxID=1947286 RepID=UPI00257AF910|nr:hypothetical protein [Proteiniphilum sp. UBA5510]